jgi:pilus assembly protein Flp/PilA
MTASERIYPILMMSGATGDSIVFPPHREWRERTTRSFVSMYRLISLILTRMTATRDDDRGATMVEYGLLVALISVVAIAFIITIGGEVATAFSDVADALTGG